jgi:hypothetical protein
MKMQVAYWLLLALPIALVGGLGVWRDEPLRTGRLQAEGKETSSRLPDSADHVRVIAASHRYTEKGDEITVSLNIDRGFHINANPASFDYLIPTSLTFVGVEPISVDYPLSMRFQPKFIDAPLAVYERTVAITALLPKNAVPLRAIVTAQACDKATCLPPADLTIVVTPVVPDETTLHRR